MRLGNFIISYSKRIPDLSFGYYIRIPMPRGAGLVQYYSFLTERFYVSTQTQFRLNKSSFRFPMQKNDNSLTYLSWEMFTTNLVEDLKKKIIRYNWPNTVFSAA